VAAVAAGGLALAQRTSEDERARPAAPAYDAIAYGLGVSTDPYGRSRPRGVGVVTGLTAGRARRAELRGRRWSAGNMVWLGPRRLLWCCPAGPFTTGRR
jgi:hypothetical protein